MTKLNHYYYRDISSFEELNKIMPFMYNNELFFEFIQLKTDNYKISYFFMEQLTADVYNTYRYDSNNSRATGKTISLADFPVKVKIILSRAFFKKQKYSKNISRYF